MRQMDIRQNYTGMNPKTAVLAVGFDADERTRLIRRYLRRQGIEWIPVEMPAFVQPLGFLAGAAGFSGVNAVNLQGSIPEEMMVMAGFSDAQLDGFLAYFRENGIPGVPLKAVLTPVNAHWNALQLYEALKEEARMML